MISHQLTMNILYSLYVIKRKCKSKYLINKYYINIIVRCKNNNFNTVYLLSNK